MSNRINDMLYAHYFEGRIKYMINLSDIDKVYKTKYFWVNDHLEDVLPSNKDSKILVLGCGIGHEVYALNKMNYKNVIGIDISDEQIEIAKSRKLNCIKVDAFKFLNINKEKYDVIIAFNFIEHFNLEKILELLTLCYKRLNKGGVIILSTPNASNPLAIHHIYGDLTHKIAFTETSIRQLLIAAGFRKIKLKNVKPFGRFDDKIIKRVSKLIMTFIIKVIWKLIQIFYLLNCARSPKVVSTDLLVIAYRE